jgi:hypothetical protein
LRLYPADVRENNPLKACPSRPRVKFGIRNTPCCRADARLSAAVCAYAIWHSQKRCGPIPRVREIFSNGFALMPFGIRKNDAALSHAIFR